MSSSGSILICGLPAFSFRCSFGRVLRIPARGCFILHFGIAGDGGRCLRILSAFEMKRKLVSLPSLAAAISDLSGGLKKV